MKEVFSLKIFIKILLVIVNITWCLPQNVIGFFVYLWSLISGTLVGRRVSRAYGGKFDIVSHDWARFSGSLSLGEFRFIHMHSDTESRLNTIYHEYGHTIQSYILGPLYLLVIGLPSIIWCELFRWYRLKYDKPYDWFYTEKFATYLGNKFREVQDYD